MQLNCHYSRRAGGLAALCALAILSHCTRQNDHGPNGGGGINPQGVAPDAGATTPPGPAPDCSPSSLDLTGCACGNATGSRACYPGPAATRNVGSCHDGTQTCSPGEFSVWSPCTGAVVPSAADACAPSGGNGGGSGSGGGGICTPPTIDSGGNKRCAMGSFFDKGQQLCCPCDATTCDQLACCVATVCASAASCTMCLASAGQGLDPACNGRVDADCDDFPEDCDQLCCPCKPAGVCNNNQGQPCGQGQILCPSKAGRVCVDGVSSDAHCGACDHACSGGQHCVSGTCQ